MAFSLVSDDTMSLSFRRKEVKLQTGAILTHLQDQLT